MIWLLVLLAAATPRKRSHLADQLDRIERRLRALEQASSLPVQAASDMEPLREEIEALKEEAATKDDLRKYQRKANEKETKLRFTGQVELRAAYFDYRTDSLDQLAATPFAGIGALIQQNDRLLRPRVALRLYWEINRFLDEQGDDFLFAYVMPELTFFVLQNDIDRSLIARNYNPDFAAPRDQLGFIIKKAAVGIQLGRFGLSAGVLQYTYGSGFFINPTNRFTPKNPLDPRREVDGLPAAQLDLSLVQREKLTLTLQLAGIARQVRNDFGHQFNRLSAEGVGQLKASTPWFSLTGIGMYQYPNELGMSTPSFGGIASVTPFGLTFSCEVLFTESPWVKNQFKPELVASFQAFIPQIGPAGTTVIAEYYRNEHMPTNAADTQTDLATALGTGRLLLAVDRLTRTLGRRQYAILYIEPSITEKLRFNVAGIAGLDSFGVLARAGVDYELAMLTLHAYGGYTYGTAGSEFRNFVVQGFGELAVSANF